MDNKVAPHPRPPINLEVTLLFFPFLLFVTSSLFLMGGNHWYNQQRFFQLVLLMTALACALFARTVTLPARYQYSFIAIFTLGFVSSLLSQYPSWALIEWAKYLALFCLTVLVAAQDRKWLLYALITISFIGCIHSYIASTRILFVLILDAPFDALSFILGFDNIRFYGQLQIFLLPTLAWAALQYQRRSRLLSCIFLISLSAQWVLCYLLGGRGVWAALLTSHALLLFHPTARKYLLYQGMALALSSAAFLCLFVFSSQENSAVDGLLRLGLSRREDLWGLAWDLASNNPWLGVGPMHFSSYPMEAGAHPHQSILQFLAEWGAPTTILIVTVASIGTFKYWNSLKRPATSFHDIAVFTSITGSLVLSLVDGVFVTPYTETLLALYIAIALKGSGQPAHRKIIFPAFYTFALVIIIFTVYQQGLHRMSSDYTEPLIFGSQYNPRLWIEGWIP